MRCDVCQSGLGAVLTQERKPVAFASRALTPTEQRYAQIEKECLVSVFASERFHEYIYVRHIVRVQSDHQPLELVFKKRLEVEPSRLQPMLLCFQQYNLQVIYLRGKHVLLADTLSPACVSDVPEEMKRVESVGVVRWKDTLMVSEERIRGIQSRTKDDDVLQQLSKVIVVGWPQTLCSCRSTTLFQH